MNAYTTRRAPKHTEDDLEADKKIVKRRDWENTASIATMVRCFPFQNRVSAACMTVV
jgi:hypothetical protein